MKLITKFSSRDDADEASRLLETNGVATFISSKRSHRIGGLFTGAFHVGLWVILDEQYQDAQRLLSDPNHRVERKLTQSEISEIRSSVRSGDMSQVLKLLFQLLMMAALFALVVGILVRAYAAT